MTGPMRLRATDLMMADTPDFRVVASPDLLFAVGRDGYDVTGASWCRWRASRRAT